jgi:hypothetical protein
VLVDWLRGGTAAAATLAACIETETIPPGSAIDAREVHGSADAQRLAAAVEAALRQ